MFVAFVLISPVVVGKKTSIKLFLQTERKKNCIYYEIPQLPTKNKNHDFGK